jgi:hypothetical protein
MEEASVADMTHARPGLTGRERVRADGDTGAGYRTFSARLPVVLTAFGGGFVALGALGAAVRASAILRAGDDPRAVRTLMGYHSTSGRVLAVAGLVLGLSAIGWRREGRIIKVLATAVAGATAAFVAVRLTHFNDVASAWATRARHAPSFIGFHAGLGWGAWCMLVGAILAGFGVLVGVLRAIDLRKGIPG